MCPEFEILSAYFDGEIGSPWDKTIEAHCASCKDCCARLASLSRLRAGIRAIPEPDVAGSFEKIRRNVSDALDKRLANRIPIWKQSIRIPIPVFAMSMLLIAAIGVSLAVRQPAGSPGTATAKSEKDSTASELQIATTSADDVEALLNSLDKTGSPQEVVIKLPEGSRLDKVGEPTLIHSVDFKGNTK